MKKNFDRLKWEVIITLIISLTSVFVAVKANEISKFQAGIARNSLLPIFEVIEKVENNTGWSCKESSVIEISNLSGKMNNYQTEVITFLECDYLGNENAEYNNLEIPLENYYLISDKTGSMNGVIERKHTANNYDRIKKLKNTILQFNNVNKKKENIYTYTQSYLKITYSDLLNKEQVLYYELGPSSVKMIDTVVGQSQFYKYMKLIDSKYEINPNRFDDIPVSKVIDNIEGIISLGEINIENQGTGRADKIGKFNEPIITTIIGAVIGIVASVIGAIIAYQQMKKGQESFSSSILYNDLKSIEKYLKEERSSVNMRYSEDWQHMVANCSFLTDEEVEKVYSIYDKVYNFNYRYWLKEKKESVRKEDISSYEELKEELFYKSNNCIDYCKYSEKYDQLIKNLQKHRK